MTESESVALPLGDAALTSYIIPDSFPFVKGFLKNNRLFAKKVLSAVSGSASAGDCIE